MDVDEVRGPALHIHVRVVEAIDEHARRQASGGEEALGLLVGDWALDGRGEPFAVALDAPTGPLDASPVSVRFRHEGLCEVARRMESIDYDYVVVGWYHSHLGAGCFMSGSDLRTQARGFPHRHQVALIIDPVVGTAAAFANGPEGPGTVEARVHAFDRWEASPDPGEG
jgi:proteasome lid subunit RPN8/RPN11